MTDTRRDVGRAATLIGAITIGSRLAGFGRTLVFTWAIGYYSLGTAYQSANTIPNLIFELVAGGALAALVVPLLAAPLARHDPQQVNRIASALLTWALTLLIPIGIAVALLARPLVSVVLGGEVSAKTVDVASEMLVFFAPQLPLYGVAVVLTGVLQAHRRFSWPALAPLLSSVTMAGVYVAYGLWTGKENNVGKVTDGEVLLLAIGTTCGVAVLAGCLILPLRGLGLKLRPAWRLETHVASDIKSLAIAGAITLGAQQLCQALLLRLANDAGDGPVVVFTVAQTFFLLPWGVLAVPLATAAYPGLAESHSLGETVRYQRVLSQTAKAVLILAGLGVAALAGLAEPIGTVLASVSAGTGAEEHLSDTLAGLAFGLFGYSMFAIYSRGLYAVGRNSAAALNTSIGWAAAAVSALALSAVMPTVDRTLALAIAWSIGMTVIGLALVIAIARHTGAASLAGLGRGALAALTATAAAVATARGLIGWWGHAGSITAALIQGIAVGAATAIVYLGIAASVGGSGVVGLIARRAGKIRPTEESEAESGEDP